MGMDDKGLTWLGKDKEISFSVKDCTISSSALDSLKEGAIYYESTADKSYIGTTTGYKPISIGYDTTYSTITKEQEQIETLIRAVTNLIKEVEEIKKDNTYQYDKILMLEEENKTLRNSMEEMYIEMVATKDKTMILESRKADKEPATAMAASCC